jgi:hypothetical protein
MRKAKSELRIVLDEAGTHAVLTMIEQLKAEMPWIKAQPSQFVSFLVADFIETYFAKDKAVLVAEFFDSNSFHDAARREARGKENFEEHMDAAVKLARKIKARRRQPKVRNSAQGATPSDGGGADETL